MASSQKADQPIVVNDNNERPKVKPPPLKINNNYVPFMDIVNEMIDNLIAARAVKNKEADVENEEIEIPSFK